MTKMRKDSDSFVLLALKEGQEKAKENLPALAFFCRTVP